MSRYVWAYILSVAIGGVGTYPIGRLLHYFADKVPPVPGVDVPKTLMPWIAPTIGVIERAVFTTLVGWEVSGSAAFISVWIATKTIGGWGNWNRGTAHGRAALLVGLMLSALSALFGIIGGLMILRYRHTGKL